MPRPTRLPQPDAPGLTARKLAADIVDGVLRRRIPLDEQLSGSNPHPGLATLSDRDRALSRRLIATTLRRLGTLRHCIRGFLDRGFPSDAPRVEVILLLGAAQILWLDVPDHAAVDLSVRLAQADRKAAHFAGLINAVLRRIARERANIDLDGTDRDTPEWLMTRWRRTYGDALAGAIAQANAREPALDVTVKSDPQKWAEHMHGRVLPTGSVRTLALGAVTLLPGFHEGAWWVQDAAAALPANLFGSLAGLSVVDLCAAPGGKTAQLAATGAQVLALDRSPARIARLRSNLTRLGIAAETEVADIADWSGGPFDAVLLDAPCSSTGTIRRHPDVPWLKSETDITTQARIQSRLLDRAVSLTKPGGTLVYCVCSLEPEEGEAQIEALLARNPAVTRRPITPDDVFGQAQFISPAGDLRTLPCHWDDPEDRWGGLDGFFAARLSRQ